MNYDIDYNIAKRGYWHGLYDGQICPDKYRPTYIFTNENPRQQVDILNNTPGADVLTVAASGDQPLFYAAAGARHIDTFDQTFCAKAIMDMKMSAVQNLNYKEYCAFLDDLFNSHQWRPVQDMWLLWNMPKVVRAMPDDSANFVRNMSSKNIFATDILECAGPEYLKQNEFDAVRQNAYRPFRFVWADIADLHAKIDMKYDIINISNIFEWIERKNVNAIAPILRNLSGCLKPGGYILATNFKLTSRVGEIFDDFAHSMGNNWRFVQKNMDYRHLILQRTR